MLLGDQPTTEAPAPAPRARRRLTRSSRFVLCVALGLVAYAGVVAYRGAAPQNELFPFFSWNLFSRVPARVEGDYSIRLTQVSGRRLDPPVYFEDAGAYVSSSKSPDAQQLIQKFGKRVAAKDAASAAFMRSVIDSGYLQGLHNARYELVRRQYDVIKRVDCKCFSQETVVARYSLR